MINKQYLLLCLKRNSPTFHTVYVLLQHHAQNAFTYSACKNNTKFMKPLGWNPVRYNGVWRFKSSKISLQSYLCHIKA